MNILLLQKQECCQTSNISFLKIIVSHLDGRLQIMVSLACILSVSDWRTDSSNMKELSVGQAAARLLEPISL